MRIIPAAIARLPRLDKTMAKYVMTSTNTSYENTTDKGSISILLTYGQPRAITRAVKDLDRTLSLAPRCSKIYHLRYVVHP